MKTLYTLTLVLLLAVSSHAQPAWFKEFWGDANASDYLVTSIFDQSGNVYAIGNISHNGNIGNSKIESFPGFYVSKHKSNGEQVWANFGRGVNTFTNTNSGKVTAAAIHGTNLYISGLFKDSLYFGTYTKGDATGENMFILQINTTTGEVISTKTYPKYAFKKGAINSLKCNNSGDVFAAGTFVEDIDFGNSKTLSCWSGLSGELFVAKFDANLTCSWAIKPSSVIETQAVELVLDHNEDLIVSGFFNKGIDFGGGNVFVSNGAVDNNNGVRNLFIAKYSKTDGGLIWVKPLYGDLDRNTGIATDKSGNIYTVVTYSAFIKTENDSVAQNLRQQFALIKYSPTGERSWIKYLGGNDNDLGTKVAITNNNKLLVTGVLKGNVTIDTITRYYSTKGFLGVFSTDGNVESIYSFGGDVPSVVTADKNSNNYIVGGEHTAEIDFGSAGKTQHNKVSYYSAYLAYFGQSQNTGLLDNYKHQERINVYPNPTSSFIHVDVTPQAKLLLFNTTGQLVLEQIGNTIGVQHITKGLYWLQIDTKQGSSTQKIVIE